MVIWFTGGSCKRVWNTSAVSAVLDLGKTTKPYISSQPTIAAPWGSTDCKFFQLLHNCWTNYLFLVIWAFSFVVWLNTFPRGDGPVGQKWCSRLRTLLICFSASSMEDLVNFKLCMVWGLCCWVKTIVWLFWDQSSSTNYGEFRSDQFSLWWARLKWLISSFKSPHCSDYIKDEAWGIMMNFRSFNASSLQLVKMDFYWVVSFLHIFWDEHNLAVV